MDRLSKTLAMALASEAGELLAEYRWVAPADPHMTPARQGRRRKMVLTSKSDPADADPMKVQEDAPSYGEGGA